MYVCDNLLYKLLTFHLSIVPQLKTIASNLRTRTIIYRNNNLSTTQDNIIFSQPKSGARKAEWISAIANYFHLHRTSTNQLNTMLNGASTNSGSSAAASTTTTRSSLVARGAAATKRKKKSPAKKRKSPTILSNDEAIARSLQNRYMQEDSIGQLLSNSALPIMGMSNGWGNQAYRGGYSSHLPINAGASLLSASATANGSGNAELKMPAKPTVKVKKEPNTSSSSTDIPLQPRDFRESNMVSQMRGMGFTDTTEILTALRAVAAQREEVSIVSAASSHNNASMNGSNGWSFQEQTEAAMMWIVQQREEVEEAKKLDEARISSEQADMATEHSRKQTMELELKNSDMVSLLGSVDDDKEIRSKHFPYSALLCDQPVKRVLSIASSDSSGKDQVIRLLNLEKKARKWYGTVLPFSYFSYCLRPRIECWLSAESNICQKLSNESDIIEKAMFTLTEQVEGGLGRVPRIFFDAQQEAFKQGKPTASPDDSKMAGNDDDIRVVEQTMQPRSMVEGKPKMEVIEIT